MGEARLRNEPAMPKELDGAETFVLIDNVSDGMSNRHVSCWLQADIQSPEIEVRFTSRSRHSGQGWECLKLTQSGLRVSRGLRLEKHPDKTFIGRIERGFDFLGYHFGPDGLGVARATIEKFIKREHPGFMSRSA